MLELKGSIERELFVCACNNIEHQLVLSYFEDEADIYVSVHLCRLGFLNRLKVALRYIFGKRSPFGAFEEIILREEDIDRLSKILNQRREFLQATVYK